MESLPQFAEVARPARHNVGRQLLHAAVAGNQGDECVGDRLILKQHRFNLAQLDAITADLDLGVDASEVLDFIVKRDTAEIAGAIKPRIGFVGEGIANELFGGQFRAVDVANGDARPANADLAGFAPRYRLAALRRGYGRCRLASAGRW